MRILIAEDDRVSKLLLSTTLSKLGHEVIQTEDGEEAYMTFLRQSIRIVISDWKMPKMDGLKLCRKIRYANKPFYTYIILLTSMEGKSSLLEGLDAGADDFMTKPFDVETLRAKLTVAERILKLQAEVKELKGLLPTCMYCRKVRDEDNNWLHIEEYISSRTEANFSHGVCPGCYDTHIKPHLGKHKEEV